MCRDNTHIHLFLSHFCNKFLLELLAIIEEFEAISRPFLHEGSGAIGEDLLADFKERRGVLFPPDAMGSSNVLLILAFSSQSVSDG